MSGAGPIVANASGASTKISRQNLLALDDALAALEKIDSRKSQLVELRFFGGLTADETAAALGISDVA